MPGKLSLGIFKLEGVPTWVVVLVTLLVCVGAGITTWWTVIRRPDMDLVTLKQANAQLQATVDEYNQHIGEVPESQTAMMDDARGKLTVQRYADGCLVIVRSTNKGLRSKLVMDLARDDAPKAHVHPLFPVVEAAGRCVAQHYGQFKTWYGNRNGCWMEVWREWPDGCRHVQMFNTCSSSWDVNVRWTQCVH